MHIQTYIFQTLRFKVIQRIAFSVTNIISKGDLREGQIPMN